MYVFVTILNKNWNKTNCRIKNIMLELAKRDDCCCVVFYEDTKPNDFGAPWIHFGLEEGTNMFIVNYNGLSKMVNYNSIISDVINIANKNVKNNEHKIIFWSDDKYALNYINSIDYDLFIFDCKNLVEADFSIWGNPINDLCRRSNLIMCFSDSVYKGVKLAHGNKVVMIKGSQEKDWEKVSNQILKNIM